MKKITSIVISFMLLLMCCEAFAAPSGMKDIETVNTGSTVTISVGTYANGEIPYSISFKSGTDVTEYYTVKTSFGEQVYDPVDVILPQGGSQLLELEIDNVPNGKRRASGGGNGRSAHDAA